MKFYRDVDQYIQESVDVHRDALIEVRSIVRETASGALEEIAYGMPAYKWRNRPLFYFAAMKGHLGLYPTPGPIVSCADILEKYSTSKGCVRVPYTQAVPKNLIKKLIKARMNEIKGVK